MKIGMYRMYRWPPRTVLVQCHQLVGAAYFRQFVEFHTPKTNNGIVDFFPPLPFLTKRP